VRKAKTTVCAYPGNTIDLNLGRPTSVDDVGVYALSAMSVVDVLWAKGALSAHNLTGTASDSGVHASKSDSLHGNRQSSASCGLRCEGDPVRAEKGSGEVEEPTRPIERTQ
jgi:hypothetical protein